MIIPDQAPAPLEYAGPASDTDLPPAWSTVPMRTVVYCWFFQLILSLAVVIASLINHVGMRQAFGYTGGFGLVFDVPLAGVASVAALVFACNCWGRTRLKWKQVLRPAVLGVLLSVSNIPIAVGFLFFGGFRR